jgi:hypothetical protein
VGIILMRPIALNFILGPFGFFLGLVLGPLGAFFCFVGKLLSKDARDGVCEETLESFQAGLPLTQVW